MGFTWEENKDLAGEFNVTEELYNEYGNVRVYLNNIECCRHELIDKKEKIMPLISFSNSERFSEEHDVVRNVIDEKIFMLKSEIDNLNHEINKYIHYLKNYNNKLAV